MASAEAIARYFLWLAAREPEEDLVTHMRLQKLLYYAQGWSLAARGAPLFEAGLEAWQHGPVVREVYSRFAAHERRAIPEEEGRDEPSLSDPQKRFVRWVWANYGKFSTSELWRMTHGELPWLSARKGLPDDSREKRPIDAGVTREFFANLHTERCRKAGIDPDQWAAAMEDARAGRTIPLDQAIAELRA
jgi:uncharacterized phage-associated protein